MSMSPTLTSWDRYCELQNIAARIERRLYLDLRRYDWTYTTALSLRANMSKVLLVDNQVAREASIADAKAYLGRREHGRIAGKALRDLIFAVEDGVADTDDFDNVRALLGNIWTPLHVRNRAKAFAQLKELAEDAGYEFCEFCGKYHDEDEFEYSVSESARICESCRENDFVHTEDGEWVHSESDGLTYAYTSYDGYLNDYAEPFWHSSGLYELTSESARSYEHATREAIDELDFVHINDGQYGRITELEPEDEDDSDGLVAAYHHHPYRSTPWYFREPEAENGRLPMGLELEVEVNDVYSFASAIKDNWDWIMERDSSLGDGGVEVITPPKLLGFWGRASSEFFEIAQEHGLDTETDNTGTHISVARKHLSPLQEARMAFFLSAEANQSFIQAVAGRRDIYSGYGPTSIGGMNETHRPLAVWGGLGNTFTNDNGKTRKRLYGSGKLSVINFKSFYSYGRYVALAELRIFAGIRTESCIARSTQFTQALIDWTSPKACTGTTFEYQSFLEWLASREGRYPTLVRYLRQPTFVMSYGTGDELETEWAGFA